MHAAHVQGAVELELDLDPGVPSGPRLAQSGRLPAVREVLDRVGDKWSVLVIVLLGGGSKRFSELRRSIEGISQRMLTRTLRGLERDGIVTRTVLRTTTLRVDYDLTPLGRTLVDPVRTLMTWAEEHRSTIQQARARHDRSHGPSMED